MVKVKPALTLHLPGGLPMTFQRIPTEGDPKPFLIGERGLKHSFRGFSEPLIQVGLARPFYLGTYPVTQAQFATWSQAKRRERRNLGNDFKDHPDHPVDRTPWPLAVVYCAWLTQVAAGQLPSGFRLACLPTETEWEFACRGGTSTEYYTGDGEAALAEAGWFAGNAGGSPHPVGLKTPNSFGLFDLHGNVREWCHDVFDVAPYRDRADGDGDPGAKQRLRDWQAPVELMTCAWIRVLRGGSWTDSADLCRSSYRNRGGPVDRDRGGGFRVCLVRGPESRGGVPLPDSSAEGNAEPCPTWRRPPWPWYSSNYDPVFKIS